MTQHPQNKVPTNVKTLEKDVARIDKTLSRNNVLGMIIGIWLLAITFQDEINNLISGPLP